MHIQNLKTKAQKITSSLVLFALVFGLGAFTAPQAASAAELNFTASVGGFTEGQQGLVKVTLSEPAPAGGVTFQWRTYNRVGLPVSSSDLVGFDALTTTTIPEGQTSTTIDVGIVDDNIDELDEAFSIEISNPQSGNTIGSVYVQDIELADNDTVSTEFQQTSGSGLENISNPEFSVVLSNPSDRPVRVYFKPTGNGTATHGSGQDWDLNANVYTTIAAGEITKNVSGILFINNDTVDEPDETAIFQIATSTNSAPGDYAVAEPGTDDTFTYTIVDNDGANSPVLNLSTSTAFSFVESQEGSFTVYLSTTTSEPVTFEWSTSGTATAGVDYADGSANYTSSTIPAGELSKTVFFNIVDDNLDENQEDIGLWIASSPLNATLGTSRNSIYAIVDNDTSAAQFAAETSSGAENAGSANINIVLSNPSDREVKVYVKRHASSTADVSTEWTMATDTIVFAPGVTSSPVSLTLIDDSTQESSETVVLTITGADNADVTSTLQHTFTITDNDAPVSSGGGGGGGGSSGGGSAIPVPVPVTSTPGVTTTENLSVRVDSLTTIGDVVFANLVLNGGTATRMQISNNAAFENAVQVPYSTTALWKLPAGNGTKTVYVRFFNNVGAAFPVVTTNVTVSGQAEGGQVLGEQISLLDELVARLRFGTTSDEVRQLQTLLQQKGYFAKTFRPTRYYGLMTKAAVARYLADKKMANMTLGELIQTLKFGNRNSMVAKLQTELKKLGFFPANVAVTNYYGLITRAAVAKYLASR